jgi:hypothetical protein
MKVNYDAKTVRLPQTDALTVLFRNVAVAGSDEAKLVPCAFLAVTKA